MKAYERFLQYVAIDTTSNSQNSAMTPSSPMQWDLARFLEKELNALGFTEVCVDEHAFVYGTIPATPGKEHLPVLGLIAHMDTVEDAPGANIKAHIVEHYDGGDILLNPEQGIVMSPTAHKNLLDYVGQDLIVTDGTTLLGADDKAGIAEIVTMAELLFAHPEIAHGKIRVAFTPDEEIGCGIRHFDVEGFGAAYAYTVDGGAVGQVQYENFNAASAVVEINGINMHPGSSKNTMKNSILVGMEFNGMLPEEQKPCHTEGYEGFYHLNDFKGIEEHTTMEYILRDHDSDKLEQKKQMMQQAAAFLNHKYGEGTVEVKITDSYRNMKEQILPHMHLIDNAKAAMRAVGVEPIIIPIRGGTDGAQLSYRGLPCPNLSTGGQNGHGRFEFIPVQSLEKMTDMLIELVKIYAEQ